MTSKLKRIVLAAVLATTATVIAALMSSAETPPAAVLAAQTTDWIVSLVVEGSCGDEASGGIGLLCGAVLDNGAILTAGHGFWCGENFASGIMPTPHVEANGTLIPLNALRPSGLEVYGGYDLACIDVAGMPVFATGLPVTAELPQSPSLVGSAVWIVGYGRSSRPQVVTGRVTAGGGFAGDSLEIAIDVPITPGLSGSPVLNAEGEIIGVVVAKSLIEPRIYATCVTRSFVNSLIVRRP